MRHTFRFGVACLAAFLVACGGGENADTGHYAGGTLTGLATGNSVTIRDASGESVVLRADGTYRFGRFPKGTRYQISATSAQRSQTCTVANGSGQIGDQDVTNVQVACTTSYSVGGTVSGYTGTPAGLSLSLNGAETLPITSTGAFEFATSLAAQASYVVTIATQPSGYQCAVTQGSGNMPAGNVANVAVACTQSNGQLSYTVSGLATADFFSLLLSGPSLVTSPASGETAYVNANGGGQFSTLVNTGDAYEVSLAAPPVNHACTLANASGTFNAGATAPVQVSCTFTGYHVGGTIEMYAGDTATLTLYDSLERRLDTVTVSAPTGTRGYVSVPFVFGLGLNNGQSFYVAVTTPPPSGYCSSGNRGNSGTINNADVADLTFYCGVT